MAAAAGRYKMSTIVRLTGFSEALLRAWERRYRILEPARGSGGHRLYTDDDLRVLTRVRDLMAQGRSIGEIAIQGRGTLIRDASQDSLPTTSLPPAAASELDRCRAGVVDAARSLDTLCLEQNLDRAFAAASADTAIRLVVEKAAAELNELVSAGKCGAASERLATCAFMRRLVKLLDSASGLRSGGPKVIAACLPDEHHELGLLVVSYFLARSGFEVCYVGAGLPLEAVEQACRVSAPQILCLSATHPAALASSRRQLAALANRLSPRTKVVIGGAAVSAEEPDLTKAGAVLWPAGRPIRELLLEPWLHS